MVAPSLPVASVLAVGLGKSRDEWPADVIRRAAGVAARSLNGAEAVITTLSDIDLGAADRGADPGCATGSAISAATRPRPRTTGCARSPRLAPTRNRRRRQRLHAPRPSRPRWPPPAIWSTLPLLTSIPPNSPSAQRLWVRPPGSKSRCSMSKALAKEGYGGVVGVGKGSSRPPRLVRLIHRWRPRARRRRRSRWSARASRSTPAASRSSRPPTCTT